MSRPLPTEQRLLEATLVCLARHGIAKTTLDDVAREAGVSRATLYRYFPGKQALLSAAVTDRKSTLLNSSHIPLSRMPSSA